MNQRIINPLYTVKNESVSVLEIPQKKCGDITIFQFRLSVLHNLMYFQYYSPIYGEDEFNCKSWQLLDDDRYCTIHNTIGVLNSAVNTRYQEIQESNIDSKEFTVELLQFFTGLVDYFDSFRNGSPLRVIAKLIHTQLQLIDETMPTTQIILFIFDGVRKRFKGYTNIFNIALQIRGLLMANSGLSSSELLTQINHHQKFWFSVKDAQAYRAISQEILQLYQELRLPMVSTFTNDCEYIIDEVIYLALR